MRHLQCTSCRPKVVRTIRFHALFFGPFLELRQNVDTGQGFSVVLNSLGQSDFMLYLVALFRSLSKCRHGSGFQCFKTFCRNLKCWPRSGFVCSAFEFFNFWFSQQNHFRRFDVQNIVVVLTKHVAPSHKTVPITKKFCRNVEMMNFKFLCSVVWAVTKNVWKV